MKKELEDYLWVRVREPMDIGGKSVRQVIDEMIQKKMIQSPKQAWATLTKWTRKDIYEFGVCLDLGWRVSK